MPVETQTTMLPLTRPSPTRHARMRPARRPSPDHPPGLGLVRDVGLAPSAGRSRNRRSKGGAEQISEAASDRFGAPGRTRLVPTRAIPDGHSFKILMTAAPAAAFVIGIAAIASGAPFLLLMSLAGVSAFTLALNWRVTSRLSALLAAAESELRERTAAEARLRETSEILSAILMSSPVATQAFDRDCRVLVWNPASERTFGWTAEELIGRPLPEAMIPLEDREGSRERILRTLAGSTTNGERVRRLTKNGEERWVDIYAAPLVGPDGTAIGIAGQLVDVTERIRIEADLLQAQKMGAVGLLASGIAHDFNNTLTGARGFAEVIRGSTTGRVRGDVLTLIEALDRGRLLTRQLLDLARRGDGARRTVDVRQAVIGVEPLIRRLIGDSVEVELDLLRDPLHVNVQIDQLEQALINLAINGRDAMPDGGRLRIAVGAVATQPTDVSGEEAHTIIAVGADRPARTDDVEIRVSDDGVGIEPMILASVFEPFFTTKPVGSGTGLGLAMVRGFVETAEGSLTVTSRVGIGTTFSIRLPRSTITES